MRNLLTLCLLSACLCTAQQQLGPNQLRDIVRNCARSTQSDFRLRDDYTFKEQETTNTLDRDGKVRETHSSVKEVMRFAGERVEQIMQKDGKPLPAADARREQQKVDRAALNASKLSASDRSARLEKQERTFQKQNEWLTYVAEGYNFTLLREETLNGRPTYVIQALAKPDYNGKYSALFKRTKGVLYVDKELHTLAKLNAEFLDSYSFGLFLAKIDKGTRLEFEQVRVNGEIWLPKHLTYLAEARALIKSVHESGEIVFSDYRKFRTESRVVSTGGPN